jgi:hypothetical protein
MTEIRLPHITGVTEQEQLKQIKSYLYQLTGQLNFALKAVNSEDGNSQQITLAGEENVADKATEQENKLKTFIELKNLIIKSADVVEKFQEVIREELEGNYVATSDFGTYKEETAALLEKTSEHSAEYYESLKSLEQSITNKSELRKDGCYIKTGWLDDDNTIAGFEVGQYTKQVELDEDGKEVVKYKDEASARFTTNEIAFFDKNSVDGQRVKLAWFSKSVMYIANAQIEDTLTLGGYVIEDTENYGIVFKWKGR